MVTSRIEAFSDGVLAIIITIMILEIHPPHGADISAWVENIPALTAYLFSFIILAIYWNNHHHLLRASKVVNGTIMWANLHLLFWLSLVPVATAWVGQGSNFLEQGPVLLYSTVGLFAGLAYYMLTQSIMRANPTSAHVQRIGRDKKGIVSELMYALAVVLSFWHPIASLVTLACVAVVWVVPDRRLEPSVHEA